MKPSERDPLLYLEDMLVAMKRVGEYTLGLDFQQFKWDYKTVDAVTRNFQVIGEAAKNIPPDIRLNYSGIPWDEMYGLRNRIAHEYFGIDYEIIWEIATVHLPRNQEDIERIINHLKSGI